MASFFFNFENLSTHVVTNDLKFFETLTTFAFWMSLRVVMAIFPLNDIFLGHPVHKNYLSVLNQNMKTFESLKDDIFIKLRQRSGKIIEKS